MTLQWTLVSAFLYAEIFIAGLLILPLFSYQRWRRVFRSNLLRKLDAWGSVYFNVLLAMLAFMVYDGYREQSKHSSESQTINEKMNPHGHSLCLMRMFRAQRNLYIAGGALLLWIILKWMVRMVSERARLEADLSAVQKQAASASATAERLMSAGSSSADGGSSAEAKELAAELKETMKKLEAATADLEAMKAQSESTSRAYDELVAENERLQKRQASADSGDGEGKKDS